LQIRTNFTDKNHAGNFVTLSDEFYTGSSGSPWAMAKPNTEGGSLKRQHHTCHWAICVVPESCRGCSNGAGLELSHSTLPGSYSLAPYGPLLTVGLLLMYNWNEVVLSWIILGNHCYLHYKRLRLVTNTIVEMKPQDDGNSISGKYKVLPGLKLVIMETSRVDLLLQALGSPIRH
jgi:hypothetical protein